MVTISDEDIQVMVGIVTETGCDGFTLYVGEAGVIVPGHLTANDCITLHAVFNDIADALNKRLH